MSHDAILAPFFATLLLTFAVWSFMYVKRITFIQREKLTPEQLAVPGALAELSPPEVSNPSDNLKNLFEMPVLFYALVLLLHQSGLADALDVAAAWVFVAFRALHSAVHCTVNIVMLRFCLYLASALAVWFLAGRTALRVLGA